MTIHERFMALLEIDAATYERLRLARTINNIVECTQLSLSLHSTSPDPSSRAHARLIATIMTLQPMCGAVAKYVSFHHNSRLQTITIQRELERILSSHIFPSYAPAPTTPRQQFASLIEP